VTDEPPVPADAVRAELERILATKGFQNAGRLSRLLRYVTEKTLAGESEQLKEYAVGVEVFDRDASYDPRVDAIVRVEAGRLRTRLDEYYAGDGAASELRIGLPKGGYVAHFRTASPRVLESPSPRTVETSTSPGTGRSARLTLLAGAAVAIAALSLWLLAWRAHPERPSVAVLSFSEYSSNSTLAGLAARLNDDVTSEMARLGTVSVVSHTSAMQFAGSRKPLREIAEALDADFVLEASVEAEPGGIRVVVRLVNAATDRKAWVQDFHGRTDALHDLSRQIAAGAAAAILKIRPAR
jgi:TolB-like protein